eukprot:TRINITY_DN49525_c0_g1_i1.p1 TRINITY_DN49525_c0_g1~~TRINITY_DN49525_c0_g1_i1.p1  ORF type:complete len:206 (-),score=42.85 TRINITY_DN49525_c0_g1_i1:129-698(-)
MAVVAARTTARALCPARTAFLLASRKPAVLACQRPRPALLAARWLSTGRESPEARAASEQSSDAGSAARACTFEPLPDLPEATGSPAEQPEWRAKLEKLAGGRRVFHETLEFPCEFTMKAIGVDHPDFPVAVLDAACESLRLEPADVLVAKRDSGKYASLTLKMQVASADDLYAAYEAIGRVEYVKFLL